MATSLLAVTAPPDGGTLAVIAATRHYRAHGGRELGFQERIQCDHPGLQFSGTIEGQDDSATNMRTSPFLLDRHPDLYGIYNGGVFSEGSGMALRRTESAERVRLIGHRFGPDTQRLVSAGLRMAVLTQRNLSLFEVILDQLHAPQHPTLSSHADHFRDQSSCGPCLRLEGIGRRGFRWIRKLQIPKKRMRQIQQGDLAAHVHGIGARCHGVAVLRTASEILTRSRATAMMIGVQGFPCSTVAEFKTKAAIAYVVDNALAHEIAEKCPFLVILASLGQR